MPHEDGIQARCCDCWPMATNCNTLFVIQNIFNMQHTPSITTSFLLICAVVGSCNKSDQVVPNNSPVANAGKDTIVYELSTELNGKASTDPENNIKTFSWRKISGPSSFHIDYPNAAQTKVAELAEGVYQFELTVTDAAGLFSRDTISVAVLKDEITFDVAWTNDASNKMLFIQTPALSASYPTSRINAVYLYRSGLGGPGVTIPAVWFPIQKDGTSQGTYNYKIVNNTVVAYQYYDVYNNFGFFSVGNQIKLVFR